MSIEFHCPKCRKLIRAPDDAGGKQGKCPSCHQSVYVPMPEGELETLSLTPLDEAAERERKRLEDETNALRRDVMAAQSLPADSGAAQSGGVSEPKLDMQTLVIQYATCMSQGKLSEAEEYAALIHKDKRAAEDVIQQLTIDEILPPALANIPRPVLIGFLKQLRGGK